MKRMIFILSALLLLTGLALAWQWGSVKADEPPSGPQVEALGKALFFDKNLSVNRSQSCADCHAPEVGFTGPDGEVNAGGAVYEGALDDHFGNRKPPASAYAGESPIFHKDSGGWIGGMFWDGRATGSALGDPLAEQAGGPFLNPLEQAMPNMRLACLRVEQGMYRDLFKSVWGSRSLDCAKDAAGVYERIQRSIAAYERSGAVNTFSSKFDLFWDNAQNAGKDVSRIHVNSSLGGSGATAYSTLSGGMVSSITVTNGGSGYLVPPVISFMGGGMMATPATAEAVVENGAVTSIHVISGGAGYRMAPRVIITGVDPYTWQNYRGLGLEDDELLGLAVFNDPERANCASCHSLEPGMAGYPLFTDFRYDNIGVPKNPANPFYLMDEKWNPDGVEWVDYGLGGYLKSAGYAPEIYEPELGKFKVPTLRNVDQRPAPDTVKAYGHNGFFKSLEEIVRFYAWRGMMDSGMGCGGMGGGMGGGGMGGGGGGMGGEMCQTMFPAPEVDMNRAALQHINMMDQARVVSFLKTLTDGYFQR